MTPEIENEQLRTRLAEMAAEIERLQSVIDEANAQEHIATIGDTWGLFWRGADSIADIAAKHGLRVGDKLYARPIPAQQSPAVAVPDSDWLSLQLKSACSWGKTYSELRPTDWDECMNKYVSNVIADKPESPRITEQDDNLAVLVSQELYSNGGAHESQIDVARRIIGFIASRLPNRVTEQDAIEILKGFSKWEDFAGMVPTPEGFCKSKEGRALLDKLNGDKNAR